MENRKRQKNTLNSILFRPIQFVKQRVQYGYFIIEPEKIKIVFVPYSWTSAPGFSTPWGVWKPQQWYLISFVITTRCIGGRISDWRKNNITRNLQPFCALSLKTRVAGQNPL